MTMAQHYCPKCGGKVPQECFGDCGISFGAGVRINRLERELAEARKLLAWAARIFRSDIEEHTYHDERQECLEDINKFLGEKG